MGSGEDLERLEVEDSVRRKFLMDGKVDKMTSSKSIQTTIRVWTMEETLCREVVENLVEGTVRKSTFMTSLQEDLEIAWLSRQEPLCDETILVGPEPESNPEGQEEEISSEGWKGDEPEEVKETLPEGVMPEGDQEHREEENEISPEGWKGDEPEEVRCARATGGTHHQASQVVKETLPEGRMPEEDQGCQEGHQSRRMEGGWARGGEACPYHWWHTPSNIPGGKENPSNW